MCSFSSPDASYMRSWPSARSGTRCDARLQLGASTSPRARLCFWVMPPAPSPPGWVFSLWPPARRKLTYRSKEVSQQGLLCCPFFILPGASSLWAHPTSDCWQHVRLLPIFLDGIWTATNPSTFAAYPFIIFLGAYFCKNKTPHTYQISSPVYCLPFPFFGCVYTRVFGDV